MIVHISSFKAGQRNIIEWIEPHEQLTESIHPIMPKPRLVAVLREDYEELKKQVEGK